MTKLSSQKLSEKLRPQVGVIQPRSRIGKELYSRGVPMTGELERVLHLPRRAAIFNDATVKDLSPLYVRADAKCPGCHLCRKGPARLFPVQSAMLWEAHEQDGLLAPVAVGEGKTLTCLLLPDAMNSQRAVYLVKPSLRAQLKAELPIYARHFIIPTDRISIVTYNELSDANTRGILHDLQPDLIIADEAHRLRARTSARSKRFFWYMRDFPATRFCALSGTITNRSIRDFAHLAEFALRSRSPLPSPKHGDLRDWADALDGYDDPTRAPLLAGQLLKLCNAEEQEQAKIGVLQAREAARSGFRRRLVESVGVVSTVESTEAIGASLEIRAIRPELPEAVKKALDELEMYWAWDGIEHEDAMAKARVERQLASGFWYKWVWPGEPDIEWLEAKNAWSREVRDFLKNRARPNLDSPLLLANAAIRGEWDSECWLPWNQVRERPAPPVEAQWISDFVVEEARKWIELLPRKAMHAQSKRGVIWYQHSALGERVAKALGWPLFGPGSGAELNLAVNSSDPPQVVVCSIEAHKEGVNLQVSYANNLVLNPPSNATAWEQLLGRTHRRGQDADEVNVHVLMQATCYDRAMKQALVDAEYVEQTTGQRQKLLFAGKVGW